MKNIVYLDIETIPGHMENFDHEDYNTGTSTLKDPAKISAKRADNFRKMAKKKALSNIDNQIISISYAINNEPVINIFSSDELALIEQFVDSDAMDILMELSNTQVSAYNALGFDLPVIATKLFKHSFSEYVAGIPYQESKYRSQKVFDPMNVFPNSGNEQYISQARMAACLGLEDKSEMDGSMVYDEYLEGNFSEIIKYNNSDVELLREICKWIAPPCAD